MAIMNKGISTWNFYNHVGIVDNVGFPIVVAGM